MARWRGCAPTRPTRSAPSGSCCAAGSPPTRRSSPTRSCSSIDHLRPWMPWVHAEPTSLDEKVALLRRFRGAFDLGQDFVYGVFSADGTRVVGGAGLHPRAEPGTLEIGYWIRADSVRQGYATELTAALARVALVHLRRRPRRRQGRPGQHGEPGRATAPRLRRGGDAARPARARPRRDPARRRALHPAPGASSRGRRSVAVRPPTCLRCRRARRPARAAGSG